MNQNQNPANRAPGGSDREKTNKTSRPKVEIRATAEVSHIDSNTCELSIEVILCRGEQLLEDQEVILKEGLSTLHSQISDNLGTVILKGQWDRKTEEQILSLRLCLAGLPDEKAIAVKIPAIKKAIVTKKTFVVTYVATPDITTGKCAIDFECSVFDDGDKPFILKETVLKKGLSVLSTMKTDNHGKATFNTSISMKPVQQIASFRFGLVGLPDEEEVNVTVPAGNEGSPDSDPTDLYLMRHHDGFGNFKVKVRILKARAAAMPNQPFAIWYKGVDYCQNTNANGECVFDVPGKLKEGEKECLTATVPGISQKARVNLKRRKKLNNPKAFSRKWWLGVNNGRAFILLMITAAFWVASIIHGFGDPMISRGMFGDKDKLSPTEAFYQETQQVVGQKSIRQDVGNGAETDSGWSPWVITLILTGVALAYWIWSAREEIAEAVEETVEHMFDNQTDHAGDPALEKLAQMIGAYSVIRRQSAPVRVGEVVTDNLDAAPAPVSEHKHRDNSVLRFIGIDLAMEIALSALKRVFKK